MTIAEVSRKYDISADTLRYYERIGLIPPVPRTRGGLRDYGEESCGWIQLMKCMRAAGRICGPVPAGRRHPGRPQGPAGRTAGPAGVPDGGDAGLSGPAESENRPVRAGYDDS